MVNLDLRSAQTPFPYRLDRSVIIHAAPADVFKFFEHADQWASWWGKGSNIEPRRKGRVLIRHADGVDVVGEVLECDPPDKIVFTYGFLNRRAEPAGESLVTITLEPLGHSTRLSLTHEFHDAAARDEHVQGWRFQLSVFANVVANQIHGDLTQVVDGWFTAWSVADPIARKEAFARVSTTDVGLRDRFSLIDGLDDLVAHTDAYQRFFPGLRFERRGEIRHCQGVVLADWITHGDKGTATLRGTCCFTLNTKNQIEAVINFITTET